jgi:uncharacterized protein YbjT (DUF2867 family)
MNAAMDRPRTVLVVGSTGSIGLLVVEEAAAAGYQVRALVRSPDRARGLPAGVQAAVGDVTRPDSLPDAVQDVDAVVFTHGSNGNKAEMEAVDHGAVRNVLAALSERPARIALMTSIGVTNRSSSDNRSTEGPDWKRRSERLVRASGRSYTIVRPGWFDDNAPDEQLPPLFGALGSDEPNSLDGVRDEDNMPLPDEPARVRDDLAAVTTAQEETS